MKTQREIFKSKPPKSVISEASESLKKALLERAAARKGWKPVKKVKKR
jgi:hypothetical protein